MNTTSHLWSRGSQATLFLLILAGLSWLANCFGEYLGADSPMKKFLLVVATAILIILIRLYPHISLYAREHLFRVKEENVGVFPENESRIEETLPRNMRTGEIRDVLKENYSRRWRAKTRILLVMGDASQVELLVPKLTSLRWVEGDGVVLIWGGRLTETPDVTLFDAIRKLHRRPLDGIVWVTPTFQHQQALVQSAPVVSLSAEQTDNAARHLQAVFTTLRWRVPLYLWSLHGTQFVRDDVTLHSATCLFPAGCTTALCRSQLTSLAMQMAEQGTQQVTRNIRDNFLLKMANLLMPGAEAISESLSTFFSPHRPLPLAAVILSQYAENNSARVAHAWMRDERWRALLDSLPALPAELKAQRTGRSGMRVLAVCTAGLMLLWGREWWCLSWRIAI
jgi:type VI secretion system protein ImpL